MQTGAAHTSLIACSCAPAMLDTVDAGSTACGPHGRSGRRSSTGAFGSTTSASPWSGKVAVRRWLWSERAVKTQKGNEARCGEMGWRKGGTGMVLYVTMEGTDGRRDQRACGLTLLRHRREGSLGTGKLTALLQASLSASEQSSCHVRRRRPISS